MLILRSQPARNGEGIVDDKTRYSRVRNHLREAMRKLQPLLARRNGERRFDLVDDVECDRVR